MRALYVCASILVFALLAVVVLGMTVSQCRPSMFVPDNPYSAKTGRIGLPIARTCSPIGDDRSLIRVDRCPSL